MPEQFRYERRLVAFLDVLGMQTVILESEITAAVLRTVEEVYDVLKHSEQIDIAAITVEQLYSGPLGYLIDGMVVPPVSSILEKFGIDHRVTQMSDSLVCSVGLPEPQNRGADEVFATVIRVSIFLFHIRLWALAILEHGFATRGGIAVGNMYHSAPQAVGPALVRAYRTYLEAGYPRIAVERDLALDFFNGKLESFEIIRRDDDGVYYLDVLAKNPWYPGVPYDRDKLLQIINKNLAAADDDKKIKAWSWMLRRLS